MIRGNSKHFYHWIEFRNLRLNFFSANFHLMSFFLELSLENYSRPVDLSQFETSLKLSI